MVIVFSGYSIYAIYHVSKKKNEVVEESIAQNLLLEHDPVAEYLLSDVAKTIVSDTLLKRKISYKEFDFPWIYRYIRKKYFSGY